MGLSYVINIYSIVPKAYIYVFYSL
jgi:hypothetical protein